MKKYLALLIVALIAVTVGSGFAAGPTDLSTTAIGDSSTSGQVSCDNTATILRAAGSASSANRHGLNRFSITFQNHSSTAVYIAPRSDITAANAGILLTQYNSFTSDRSTQNVAWYCITASGTATVGWTEEK